MKRSKTPTFVAERRLVTQPWMEHRIDEVMNAANRMYNNGVRHYRPIVENLRNDSHFQQILSEWRKLPDDEAHKRDRRALSQEILGCLRSRGISEYEVHAFMGRGKRKSMEGAIGINILQKVGTNLYQSMEKAVFSGTEIHFRKFGETNTLEEKSAKSGIIYHPAPGKLKGGISPDQEYISFDGMDIPLKGIREKDFWLQDAMKHRIKYLRIVRKPFKTKWRYFVQLVLEGYSPRKFKKGSGKMGVDPGISTMTVDTEQGMKQHVLAPDVHSYENEVRRASVVYQRRLRAANPDNFNEDGTIRKDSENFHKVWKRTKGIQKALMELKTAHRKLYEYRKQSHGALTNECIRQAGEIVIEPVNYKGLARKAKETSRSDRKSLLKSRDGSVKKVYKYRRRKRFGSSILRHAPASFLSILKQKCGRYGVVVREINPYLVRASQYNHVTGETEKTLLSDRTKRIDGHLVQRDGYSSFLIRHVKTDGETIDRESCKKDFKEYLKHQGREVARKFRSGDPTGCFGLPDFQKRKNVNTIFQTAI